MLDVSDACPALFVALHDALQLEPCMRRLSCWRKNKNPQRRVLGKIRECWELIPEAFHKSTFQRLQKYHFLLACGYRSMPLERIIYYFHESQMLGNEICEHFEIWLESQKSPTPAKTLFRILFLKEALQLEVVDYCMELVPSVVKHQIGKILLTELGRICRVRFPEVMVGRPEMIEIQFTEELPKELRPIQVGYST